VENFSNVEMLNTITKHKRSSQASYNFCLLIPSWNNLEYLKNCIGSIQKNSHFQNQIIVIVNEGNDGTVNWLESQFEIDYVAATKNIGICYALNIARSLIKSEYITYVNDDMYMLPDWDIELYHEIQKLDSKLFMLSSTMIEPLDTHNPCVIIKNYGTDLATFQEDILLREYSGFKTSDWNGSMWPPTVVHIDLWDLVGGMSIEYSPGMYSDPDFARKLYEAGVRTFKGKGTSLVYHFGSKTTKRLKNSRGRKIFLSKWRITANTFKNDYLKLGTTFSNEVWEPKLDRITLLRNRFKRILNSW